MYKGESTIKLNYTTLVLATFALVAFEARFCTPPWTLLRIAALLLAGISFGLLVLARLQLGAAFSVQAKAQTLVTRGLYSRIRHPIYVFSTLLLASLVVFDRAPWLLLGLLALVPMQIYRARNEGKLLAQRFGATYAAYKQQTWF